MMAGNKLSEEGASRPLMETKINGGGDRCWMTETNKQKHLQLIDHEKRVIWKKEMQDGYEGRRLDRGPCSGPISYFWAYIGSQYAPKINLIGNHDGCLCDEGCWKA